MTQVYSQNGWPAFHTPQEGGFVRFTAGGRGWWAANADAATVAQEFIDRFNVEVEPVVEPGEVYDDWSFADRLVRGSTADVSNHGSATAWDINATRHLLGDDNTFSDADEARLLAIEHDITDDSGRPVLRWGGSYSGRKDEMHIEINATKAQVRQAADKIRAQAQKEDDMQLTDTVVLTAAQARNMNLNLGPDDTPFEAGDKVKVERLLVWGGPGMERLYAAAQKSNTALAGLQLAVTAQGKALEAIAANSPDAIRAALDEFSAKLKAELAAIDVHVTLGSGDDAPASQPPGA